MKRHLGTVATVAALALVAGCGGGSARRVRLGLRHAVGVRRRRCVTGTITVFAAASLTESFSTLGKQFEAAHPGTTVKFNFAASSALAAAASPRARRPTCSPRPARRTWSRSWTPATPPAPTTFAKQRHGDRGPAGQPGQGRPRSPTWPSPASRSRSASRRCRAAWWPSRCSRRPGRHRHAGDPGARRQVGADQGRAGRGRRRHGVLTDVQAAGTQGQGRRDPGRRRTPRPRTRSRRCQGAPKRPAPQAFVDYVLSADGAKVLAAGGLRQLRDRRRRPEGLGRGQRRRRALPWPLAVPAVIAIAVPASCRWSACWSGRPGGSCRAAGRPGVARRRCGCRWSRATARDRGVAACSGCRWPGCWPGCGSRAGRWCGRWSRCRWCCRRSSAAWRCCWRFGRRGLVGQYLDRWFGMTLPFTTGRASCWPRRSWRCRSSSSPSRARCARPTARYEEAAATLGASRWTRSAGSRCR